MALILILVSGCGQQVDETVVASAPVFEGVVEAGCGQTHFGMSGEGCDLAVRIDGKAYKVEGTTIEAHGDAHAEDGMCNVIRQAKVTGSLEDEEGVFWVESFSLLPLAEDTASDAEPATEGEAQGTGA